MVMQTLTEQTLQLVAEPSSTMDAEKLSALWDGECPAADVESTVAAYGRDPQVQLAWRSYQHISHVLGGQITAPANPDFVAGVMAQVALQMPPQSSPRQLPVERHVQTAPVRVPIRPEASNDHVFRWKWVAGVAAVLAVAAVTWQVAVLPTSGAQPQWAVLTEPVPQSEAVALVQTGHGAVLRDPALDEMMAAHRPYGGMTALQVPAGYLRNTTYDDTAP